MVTLSYDVIHKKSVKNGRVVYETVPEAESHVNKRTVSIWCGGLNTDWMAKDFRCVPFAKLDDGLIRMEFLCLLLHINLIFSYDPIRFVANPLFRQNINVTILF